MANSLTLKELRREGFVTAECDRRLGPVLVKDLFGFGDVQAYDPTHLRRPRLVNGCLEDVNSHIEKYLHGGIDKKTGKVFGYNEHLPHLITWWDLYIYSFVLRKMKDKDGKKLDRDVYYCRKWRYVLSPQGQGGFERKEP